MAQKDVFAVIWGDMGIPLHLKFHDAGTAIAKAQEMHKLAPAAMVTLHGLRAVRLPAGEDTIITLWEPSP